jgi:integrase
MGFVEPTKFSWVNDANSGTRTKKPARGTKWKARYTDPAGRDRRRTFERKMDAEKFLERVGTEMQTSEWIDPKTTKSRFDDWVDVWWKTTVKLAPSTRRGYEKMLRLYLRPKFDGRKISSIEWLEVELFATALLENELSAKTVRETLSVLSLIMKTAMRARVIRENPASGHTMPSRRKQTQILAMPEIVRLVAHTEVRYRPAIWLLVLAGLRASELCGLRVMDIDWQANTLTVNEVQMWVKGELVVKGPKTASGVRTIPLPAWLVADISTVINARAESAGIAILATDRLFTSPTGKPMLDHTIWRIVNRAQESAGLPRFRPYDLRHSHASLLINLGAHPKAISERMGHTEIGVTMDVYGHLFKGAQGQLTQDLEDLIERSRAEICGEPNREQSKEA